MRRIEDQTYYEILEVSPTATVKEIQRAYDHARETFSLDSLAVYTLFNDQEIKKIQGAIEEAYQVLMDEALRKSYDQSHPHAVPGAKEEPPEIPAVAVEKRPNLSFTDIAVEIGEVSYRGTSLKQLRERLGVDLATISAETRISLRVLEWIEEESLEKLPALVYLRGFLKAYASCLGLDPQRVIDGYLSILPDPRKK